MEESTSTEQREETPTSQSGAPQPKLSPRYVHQFVEQIVGDDFHAKRTLPPANGVVGVLHAAALAVHYIGQGLAVAEGLDPKHAIKQVDRLLSNSAISVWLFFSRWVPFVVAERKALRVAISGPTSSETTRRPGYHRARSAHQSRPCNSIDPENGEEERVERAARPVRG